MIYRQCVTLHKHEAHIWVAITQDGAESFPCQGKNAS